MAFIIKGIVKSKDLKYGDFVSKGPGSEVYRIHSVGSEVKISKVHESMILGVAKDIFDSEGWRKCELSEKVLEQVAIKRKPVASTNILSEGYDESTQTLELEFSGGGVYQYFTVPKTIYSHFLASESKGREFYNEIKGKFKYKKIK